jgi:hypothetical protein
VAPVALEGGLVWACKHLGCPTGEQQDMECTAVAEHKEWQKVDQAVAVVDSEGIG